MTRIDFHLNTPDKVDHACRVVRKAWRAGQRVVVFCDEPERLDRLDQALWTFSPADFIAHARAGDPQAALSPVILFGDPGQCLPDHEMLITHHEVLINLGTVTPGFFASFERLIEVVESDETDRAKARSRYRHYREHGYPLETHEIAPRR